MTLENIEHIRVYETNVQISSVIHTYNGNIKRHPMTEERNDALCMPKVLNERQEVAYHFYDHSMDHCSEK